MATKRIGWIVAFFATLELGSPQSASSLTMEADYPYARAAVPGDGKIRLTDYGTHDWGPELVHYTLDDRRFPPGKLTLVDSQGRGVPFQIEADESAGGASADKAVLSFVAALPKGESVTYTLRTSPRDGCTDNATLQVQEGAAGVEMANQALALRLPPQGERLYVTPEDATRVSPPTSTACRQWPISGGLLISSSPPPQFCLSNL